MAQVEAVTGPVTRVPFITFSDGAGGWYPVAAMPPDAARALLAPWAAEQLVAGRAVALLGAPGQAVLDDDVSVVTLEAVAAPDGGPVTLSPGLDADYLVPAAVLDQVAVGRPPLDMLLLHPEPLTTEQADAIARVQGGQDPDRNVETQWPALDQLREARRNAQDAPVDTAEPNSVAVGRSDVWLHVDTPATAESMAEDLQATPMMQPEDREDRAFQRVLRIVALVAGGLSLLVLTITLSLRAVDSVDDHRAAVAAGAAPARIRRQHALEGVVLASLGAVLAIPLGWLPVTAVRFGQVRRRSFSPAGSSIDIVSSRLHVPGWEVVPILVLPIAAVGVLWLVVPLLRTLAQRGPVDQVLPRT